MPHVWGLIDNRAAMKATRVLSGSSVILALLVASPAFADSLASGTPSSLLEVDDAFVSGVDQPTSIAFLPDGSALITEQGGNVRLRTPDGTLQNAGSISVNRSKFAGEQGLLNVLPHPDFAENRLLFFYYTTANDKRVVTIELGENNQLQLNTEKVIVSGIVYPPGAGGFSGNHNGGALTIYDGKLYIGAGDGGSNSNAAANSMTVGNYYGTCLTNLNGKILRVNLDGSIPEDNPLVGKTATGCAADENTEPSTTSSEPKTEIWAWGLRNPWRIWADPKTGNLWVGDVGEITYEEINVIPKAGGVHMGWPWREGHEGFPLSKCGDISPNVGDCIEPTYICEQDNKGPGGQPDNPNVPNSCESITGGVILNDCEWPAEFEGRYVFGDYAGRRVWTLEVNDDRSGTVGERVEFLTVENGRGPVHIVEHQGALYVVGHSMSGGGVTRIAPKTPEASCGGSEPGGTGGMGGMSGGGAGEGGGTPSDGGTAGSGEAGASSGGAPTGSGGTAPAQGGASPGSGGMAQSSGGMPGAMGGAPGTSGAPSSNGGGTATGGQQGASGAPAGASGGSSGANGEGATADLAGCGCRTVGSRGSALGSALAALALGLFAARRRRK